MPATIRSQWKPPVLYFVYERLVLLTILLCRKQINDTESESCLSSKTHLLILAVRTCQQCAGRQYHEYWLKID